MSIKEKIKSIFNSGPSGSELSTVWLEKRRQNYDFEVISMSCFDCEANEYLDVEDFHIQMLRRECRGEDVSHIRLYAQEEELEECGLAFRVGNAVDMHLAKSCGFGVVRFMTGEHHQQKFMFLVKKFDAGVQLFAYQVLSNGKYNKELWNALNTPEGLKYIRIVLGEEICFSVLDKIR